MSKVLFLRQAKAATHFDSNDHASNLILDLLRTPNPSSLCSPWSILFSSPNAKSTVLTSHIPPPTPLASAVQPICGLFSLPAPPKSHFQVRTSVLPGSWLAPPVASSMSFALHLPSGLPHAMSASKTIPFIDAGHSAQPSTRACPSDEVLNARTDDTQTSTARLAPAASHPLLNPSASDTTGAALKRAMLYPAAARCILETILRRCTQHADLVVILARLCDRVLHTSALIVYRNPDVEIKVHAYGGSVKVARVTPPAPLHAMRGMYGVAPVEGVDRRDKMLNHLAPFLARVARSADLIVHQLLTLHCRHALLFLYPIPIRYSKPLPPFVEWSPAMSTLRRLTEHASTCTRSRPCVGGAAAIYSNSCEVVRMCSPIKYKKHDESN
ncbi:hypothetical protein R3P38DRAFT_3221408 [Favolaschia claudopus]|uniref:Uncharacterized protein n=1 Tax=Favolaschia claudopus TaxID=2862362 RepID=A0AAW0A115_9AGAR